jgi:hypothetical protein
MHERIYDLEDPVSCRSDLIERALVAAGARAFLRGQGLGVLERAAALRWSRADRQGAGHKQRLHPLCLRRAERGRYAHLLLFGRSRGRRHWKGHKAMPVKAGVIRAGARNTRRGAAETFTGVVFQDPAITAEAPSRLGGSVVTFTPGARTAWHSHPVGQTLFCLSGVGRICFKARSRKC